MAATSVQIKEDYCRKIAEIDRLHGEIDRLRHELMLKQRTNERLDAIRNEYRATRLETYRNAFRPKRPPEARKALYWATLAGLSIGASIMAIVAVWLI